MEKKKVTKRQLKVIITVIIAINLFVIIGIFIFTGKEIKNGETDSKELIVNVPDENNINLLENNNPDLKEVAEKNNAEEALYKEEEVELSENEYWKQIYLAIIEGTYNVEDGISFTFGPNGKFSGFYNEENTNVENYSYDISGEIGKEDCCIVISNPTFTDSVSYNLVFNDGHIFLNFGSNNLIELGF